MKYRESNAIEEAKIGLAKFRERDPFPLGYGSKIYEQLENTFHIDISKSQLVRWLPESDGFYSITVIDQHGNICEIETTVDDSSDSTIDQVQISEFVKSNRFKQLKPWDDLKVAIELYQSENRQMS